MMKKVSNTKLELVGLPASGKTTFVNNFLVENPEYEHLVKISKLKRYFYTSCFIIFRCFIFYNFLKLICREQRLTQHPALKHKIFFLFFRACAREWKVRNAQKVILDEGLCQFVFSLYERKITNKDLVNDLQFLVEYKNKYKIIIMSTTKKAREQRFVERGRRFRTIPDNPEYSERFNAIVEHNCPLIERFFEENFTTERIRT